MLRFVFALLAVLFVAVVMNVGAEPADRVVVCHQSIDEETGEETDHYIEINGNALPAHLAHGDFLAPEGAVVGDSCVVA